MSAAPVPFEDTALDAAAQRGVDDAAYRRELAYLFAHSPFYSAKLSAAGFRAAAGSADSVRIAAVTIKVFLN